MERIMEMVKNIRHSELGCVSFQIRGPVELISPIANLYSILEEISYQVDDFNCICSEDGVYKSQPQEDCAKLEAIKSIKYTHSVTDCECSACEEESFPCFKPIDCPNLFLTMLSRELGQQSVLCDCEYDSSIEVRDTYINGHSQMNADALSAFLSLSAQIPEIDIIIFTTELCSHEGEHVVVQINKGEIAYIQTTSHVLGDDWWDDPSKKLRETKTGIALYNDFTSRVIDSEWFIDSISYYHE